MFGATELVSKKKSRSEAIKSLLLWSSVTGAAIGLEKDTFALFS